jgi:hypothetical protein
MARAAAYASMPRHLALRPKQRYRAPSCLAEPRFHAVSVASALRLMCRFNWRHRLAPGVSVFISSSARRRDGRPVGIVLGLLALLDEVVPVGVLVYPCSGARGASPRRVTRGTWQGTWSSCVSLADLPCPIQVSVGFAMGEAREVKDGVYLRESGGALEVEEGSK